MPEGDTVWHTAAILRDALQGKTLTRCDIRVPKFATVDLSGQHVDEVISRGKHLFIRTSEASIHSHLKMEGKWQVNAKPRRPDHRARIILEAGEIQAIGTELGTLEILPRDCDQEPVAHLGPDLLGPDWDPHKAAQNLTQDPERALHAALLDQRNLAGVGNVYANELCFIVGRRPSAPVSTVKDPLRLVQRARDMLWLNRNRWNRTTTGDTRPGRQLWVYGRAGQACRRCGTLIESADRDRLEHLGNLADRITFWCRLCQP
ncbi:Fpg/Nei family DNA glycosylase [Mycobacterium sp. CBMA293]|uniref:endonuclease VIII Nei2 n=2 Tax=Mycolicibacterium TaxID=1866885 RepID=UPI0012DE4FDC|nr:MULTISPECIES: endonuclease VIII Nei2 [unclassified Mycolicibacterium]MUL46754.1 Fpg/Nei family DNA glycosylase [Mycolicibacterium sp. CBMA 360]MUL57462.1 Fpg/Nei family DNA glycosylase [Mycolicibacterium sp. CBMA 335]MUL70502.1 Fpg/Nei family DNA glycosylase [Mycolicibacterium sp. CBMA 311]MUL92550.1 Fpg/Nei family DNA glycosylase [Mycolicibacterium sp. CBMA 230]MUM04926.1 DNA glycosylase [Mycolicibacterium sp. CBMA 213]